MSIRAGVAAVLVLLFSALSAPYAMGQERTPLPTFTGERLYVAGVENTFEAVRAEIARIEDQSPQTFYVVVVKSAGEGEWATRTYVDDLYQAWQAQAARNEQPLDMERSVIIVLGVENRQLAVHAGRLLQAKFGLQGQTIDREVVGPKFTPYAKAGDYVEGLKTLVREMDGFIQAKETNVEQPVPQTALAELEESAPAAHSEIATESHGHAMPPGDGYSAMPVAVGLSLAVLGLAFGLRWFWSRLRLRKMRVQLQQFKSQVVAINDTLDAIQKRHKMLPFADADYTEPMLGETLALYNAAEAALARYRQRWLELMDAWEKAQALLQQEGPLGTKRLKAASQVLLAAKVADETTAITRDCVGPLDRLEQGHERATELASTVEHEQQSMGQQRAAIEAAQLATAPYEKEIAATATLAAQGRELLRADPIGAQSALVRAIESSSELRKRMETVLRLHQQVGELREKQTATVELAGRKRKEGLLLIEEQGNPDAALADTEESCRAAQECLNAGAADRAARQVERAAQAVAQAGQAIEQTIAARTKCSAELPASRAGAERLRGMARSSHTNRGELDRDFAPESWREVAGHWQQAQALLDSSDRRTAEAATAASERVQHYLRGAELLALAQGEQQQSAELLAALDRRLVELRELRRRCQELIRPLQDQAGRTAEFLRRSTADRPRANQRHQAASQLLAQAAGHAAQPRADWLRLQKELDEVRSGLEQAMELAQQDVRLADQAAAEIADSQRAVLAARSWYSHGVSADVSGAESQLAQAQRSLHSQAYEDAIAQAGAARQSAQAAQQAAARQVQLKQMQQEEERRRREAALRPVVAAGAVAGLAALQHAAATASQTPPTAAQSTPPPPSVPTPPAPPAPPAAPAAGTAPTPEASPSSQSSWNSSSSQTSW